MEESVFDPTEDRSSYDFGDSGFGFGSDDFYQLADPTAGDADFMAFMTGAAGDQEFMDFMADAYEDPKVSGVVQSAISALGSGAKDFLKRFLYDPATGKINMAGVGTAALALSGLTNKDSGGGYNVPVPKMDVAVQRPVYDDTNRRPGEAGRRYFTTPTFVAQGDTANMEKAQASGLAQKAALEAAAPRYAPPAANPYAGKIPLNFNPPQVAAAPAAGLPAVPTREQIDMQNQQRAPVQLAQGGIADAGRYLQGKTDGMADEIETSIDGEQPALLSHGEFVIPADVVSHLGNGNSEAGAEKLYSMMDKIRQARTGTKEQGKEINADKFLAAASGGLAAYAGGGAVQAFNAGGATGPNTPTPTTTGAGGIPLDVSRSSTLSPYVGEYVTGALGKGAALANAPYQAYQGPLTAGASNLQQQAFAGASDIASAGFTPNSFTGGFGATQANQYMNPYIQASLDPQLKELQRQADIQRVADAGRLTGAGAFGGSRQAIMESEGRRNLLDKQQELIGSGYKSAYDTGLGQFNKERDADEASRRFSADFGLKSVQNLADMGATERGITSEGLAADRAQFQEERDFAYKMPQYQLGLLSGLPIGANTTAVNQDAMSQLKSQVSGFGSLYDMLAGLGQTKK